LGKFAIVFALNRLAYPLWNRYFLHTKKKSALSADVFFSQFLSDICLLHGVIHSFTKKHREKKYENYFMNSGRKKLFFVFSLCQVEKVF
jgi:hypothetical protein